MEKRISYSQFQQVKSAAKMIDPLKRKMQPLRKKIEAQVNELKSCQTQVDALEAGIVQILGFHVADLVKKAIVPTGKTDANGKPVTVTKYLPTDIVRYDEQKKEYVIEIPSTDEINTEVEQRLAEEQEAVITNEETSERVAAETEAEENGMPWENN